ncbi:MAG: UDP-N-acetylglucosamine 2-epimerase (non-hydrolyzing) [Deltaproteobacteria bacterium]|nr:UDP-N-acetylglucosamine 2-epimerase (non-hydrolyzing) [Deltaproteobacteria bacterium]
MTTKLLCVAGARPNFPKIAPLMHALQGNPRFVTKLIHTGQHYDDALSKIFFDELNIPRPDLDLEVGSASHAVQTAELLKRFEQVLKDEQPQAVLVVGDVNSTVACALASAKFFLDAPFTFRGVERQRPVMIHVEAGLRSFDDDMPEEINRRVTDNISEMLFVTDPAGEENLKNEGVDAERVNFVGNVMIDTLLAAKEKAMASDVLTRLKLEEGAFALLTLHRPSNVDDPATLREILGALDEIAKDVPIVFPMHPRTKPRIADTNMELDPTRWITCPPMGYLDFLKLEATAKLVLTDSGGIQEETTVLGVPCLTLRENTERPVTITEGTNVLARTKRETILAAYAQVKAESPAGRIPRYWDGHAAERIVKAMEEAFGPK